MEHNCYLMKGHDGEPSVEKNLNGSSMVMQVDWTEKCLEGMAMRDRISNPISLVSKRYPKPLFLNRRRQVP